MIGWPTGTPRIGGFAAEHPERVERIVLFAPPPFFDAEVAPEALPEPGAPMLLQTRDRLEKERWLADVKCADQIDDDSVRDVMWKALMQADGLGASWKPGGIMRAPNRMNFGWHGNVAKIKAPTLTLLGAQDYFERRHDAWKASTMEQKMLVKIACGAHYLKYEKNPQGPARGLEGTGAAGHGRRQAPGHAVRGRERQDPVARNGLDAQAGCTAVFGRLNHTASNQAIHNDRK